MALFLILVILAGLTCGVWAFCLSWQAALLMGIGILCFLGGLGAVR